MCDAPHITLHMNGEPVNNSSKALIEEEFADGIMSAIDLDGELERRTNGDGTSDIALQLAVTFIPLAVITVTTIRTTNANHKNKVYGSARS